MAESDRVLRNPPSTKHRRTAPTTPHLQHPLLGLQRSAGNRATVGLLSGVQRKLEVGSAIDPCEREADAIADRVVRRLQRHSGGAPETTIGSEIERPVISRRASNDPEAAAVNPATEGAIRSARGGGDPLSSAARTKMEGAFGVDLSRVRLHHGPEAARLNRQVQAKAFTVGTDIFFRDGVPDDGTAEGQSLLAHELAHTVQQRGADEMSRSDVIRRRIGFEIETGIPITKRAKLKKGGYIYKDIVVSDVGTDLPAPGGKLAPDHIPGNPAHAPNDVEQFTEWPIIEYVTDPIDDTLKMDAFEVLARRWLAEIRRIKRLAREPGPTRLAKSYYVGLPTPQQYSQSDWDRIAPQATVGVPLDQVSKVLGAFDKNKGVYGDQLATQYSQQAPGKAAVIMQGLFQMAKPGPGDGAAVDGIKALLTMLINHLLAGGDAEISKTSYIKNRPVNVMFKTKLSTVRNNLTSTQPYAAAVLDHLNTRDFLRSELLNATGRTADTPVFISGRQRNAESGTEVATGSSDVTVGEWIYQVLRGDDDEIFDEMKNAWANELRPDATNEMVIELRKLGSFVEHTNYKLEDESGGLLPFLKKVYGAHQLYKQRLL